MGAIVYFFIVNPGQLCFYISAVRAKYFSPLPVSSFALCIFIPGEHIHMPVIAAIGLLIEILCIIHALKTGKDRYWIFIIIFAPGLGCLAYFLMEILPALGSAKDVRNLAKNIENHVNPQGRIRELEYELSQSSSYMNKKKLADAYVNAGNPEKALPLYKDCLKGQYENDEKVLEGISLALFFMGNYQEAENYLIRLQENRSTPKTDAFDLLLARTLESLGKMKEAGKKYAELVKSFPGEEARYRYGIFLEKTGKPEQAKDIFHEIVTRAKHAPRYYRKTQKKWIQSAKRHL